MLLVASDLIDVAARAVEHRIVILIAFRRFWPIVLIDVRGLLAQVLLDLAQDRCGLALEGLDCGHECLAISFQLGDGFGVVLVGGSGHVIELRFDFSRLVIHLIFERGVVIALDLLDQDALQLARMEGFKGIEFGCAFPETCLEDMRPPFRLLNRATRQPILDALVVGQHNRADLNVEVKSLFTIERVLDLAGDRHRHRSTGRVEIGHVEDPHRQSALIGTSGDLGPPAWQNYRPPIGPPSGAVALSRLRRRSTLALRGLRCSVSTAARSSSVSASSRIVAMAFGAQVENRRGLCSPLISTLRVTEAAALGCPEIGIARSSSLSFTKLSASSISKVGRISST